MHRKQRLPVSLAVIALAFCSVTFSGCERKETMVDIDTPSGSIEVERSLDTGKVDIDINEN